MSVKFTIQGKLLAMSMLGLLFVCAVGATGYVAASKLSGSTAKVTGMGAALMMQMTADQDHDALRSDVLSALMAGEKKDEAEEKSVRAEFAEHAKELRESMKTLETAGLDGESLEALHKTGPALLAYLDSADKIIDLSFKDHEAALARLSAFVVDFKTLERDMASMSDKIQHQAEATRAASESVSATRARRSSRRW